MVIKDILSREKFCVNCGYALLDNPKITHNCEPPAIIGRAYNTSDAIRRDMHIFCLGCSKFVVKNVDLKNRKHADCPNKVVITDSVDNQILIGEDAFGVDSLIPIFLRVDAYSESGARFFTISHLQRQGFEVTGSITVVNEADAELYNLSSYMVCAKVSRKKKKEVNAGNTPPVKPK